MNYFDIISPVFNKLAPGAKKSFEKINALVGVAKTDRILDLGGGGGRIAEFFINKVEKITVADSSRGMIRQCKKHKEIDCVLANAESLPFGNEYFNKIIMVDAFHHFYNQEKVAREAIRVLKKKGKIFIEEFNPKKPAGFLIYLFERALRMNSYFHTPESLSALWMKHNLDIKMLRKERAVYYLIGEKK